MGFPMYVVPSLSDLIGCPIQRTFPGGSNAAVLALGHQQWPQRDSVTRTGRHVPGNNGIYGDLMRVYGGLMGFNVGLQVAEFDWVYIIYGWLVVSNMCYFPWYNMFQDG